MTERDTKRHSNVRATDAWLRSGAGPHGDRRKKRQASPTSRELEEGADDEANGIREEDQTREEH